MKYFFSLLLICFLNASVFSQQYLLHPAMLSDSSILKCYNLDTNFYQKIIPTLLDHTAFVVNQQPVSGYVNGKYFLTTNKISTEYDFIIKKENEAKKIRPIQLVRRTLSLEDISEKMLSNIEPGLSKKKRAAVLEFNRKNIQASQTEGQTFLLGASNEQQFFKWVTQTTPMRVHPTFSSEEWLILTEASGIKDASLFEIAEAFLPKDTQRVLILGHPEVSFWNTLPEFRITMLTKWLPRENKWRKERIEMLRTFESPQAQKRLKTASFDFKKLDSQLAQVTALNIPDTIKMNQNRLFGQLPGTHPYRKINQRSLEQWLDLQGEMLAIHLLKREYSSFFSFFETYDRLQKQLIRSPKKTYLDALTSLYQSYDQELEKQMLGLLLHNYFSSISKKFIADDIASLYLQADKSMRQWPEQAFLFSNLSAPSILSKLQGLSPEQIEQTIESDYLYRIWKGLQVSEYRIAQVQETVTAEVSQQRNAYLQALRFSQNDTSLMPDADGSPRLAIGKLYKNKANEWIVDSRLLPGFGGGVVFDKKGKEVGMLSAIPFEAYEYYRSDKTSHYPIYTFNEILKTFDR